MLITSLSTLKLHIPDRHTTLPRRNAAGLALLARVMRKLALPSLTILELNITARSPLASLWVRALLPIDADVLWPRLHYAKLARAGADEE